MKQFVIILFCLFCCYIMNAQGRRKPATAHEQAMSDSSWNCALTGTLSAAERLKNYPFNKASQVQLVSFKQLPGEMGDETYKDSLPRRNDTICYSRLFEVITLTPSQVDSLTNVLYNYGRAFVYRPKRKVYFIDTFLQCFRPRNAILFLDDHKKVFEFVEICFECENDRKSSEKISLGDECNQRYLLIKNFFLQTGITYVESEWLQEEYDNNMPAEENTEAEN